MLQALDCLNAIYSKIFRNILTIIISLKIAYVTATLDKIQIPSWKLDFLCVTNVSITVLCTQCVMQQKKRLTEKRIKQLCV